MLIQSKYFGEIHCDPADTLHFPDGLFGFEDETSYFLLPFEGSQGGLLCLQSSKTPTLAFVLMNPFFLKPDYAPILSADELRRLAVSQSEALCYYVLCVVRQPLSESTVNLKCPIVINDDSRQCLQVILDQAGYDMRHPLSEFGQREASAPC